MQWKIKSKKAVQKLYLKPEATSGSEEFPFLFQISVNYHDAKCSVNIIQIISAIINHCLTCGPFSNNSTIVP